MRPSFPARPMAARPVRIPGAAALAAALLAACSSPAPPPVAVAPPPPPPVSLSPKVVEQASAYRAYVLKAAAISPNFTDGAQVAESLRAGAAYEPGQLLSGAIAYGAVAALQDPDFVAGVRKYAADADQRRTVAYEIMKDPAYAVGFSGSSSAAGLVIAALGDDGQRLLNLGRSVTQAAYDVQHSAWSKAEVPGRDARLALAKELSSRGAPGEVAETAQLQMAVTGGAPMGIAPRAVSPPYTPVVIKSLAVAALAALGYADDASLAQVMPILSDPPSANCLNLSKLNLYQCLAVAKPQYEDVFCLGQHVLKDTGRCLLKGAGVTDPEDERLAAIKASLPVTPVSPTAQPYRPAKPKGKKR